MQEGQEQERQQDAVSTEKVIQLNRNVDDLKLLFQKKENELASIKETLERERGLADQMRRDFIQEVEDLTAREDQLKKEVAVLRSELEKGIPEGMQVDQKLRDDERVGMLEQRVEELRFRVSQEMERSRQLGAQLDEASQQDLDLKSENESL